METTKTVLAPGERITVIDALRGFSLIGICLIHSMQHFGAMGTMTSQAVFPWEGTMNEIFSWLINYLVFGKFFIIFSCLFGLSFFIQMDRAAKKGLDFRPVFCGGWFSCWRSVICTAWLSGWIFCWYMRYWDLFWCWCINGRPSCWQGLRCISS